MFINFHASPRRRGARPRFEWWQYQAGPGRGLRIINFLSQKSIESRTMVPPLPLSLVGTCFSTLSCHVLSPGSSGAVDVRARVPSMISGRKKKTKRDLATLRTKTRPSRTRGIRVHRLVSSLHEAVKRLFCTDDPASVGNRGHGALSTTISSCQRRQVSRIPDRK